MRFNNPIAVSNWERNLVWAHEAGEVEDCKIPDVMLSVGAGVQDKAVRESTGLSIITKVLPSGVKERVGAIRQIYKATLNCEREFQDFSRGFEGQPELRSRCHRLNIVLPDQPCKLDAVDKLEELDDRAKRFLREDCRIRYDANYKNEYGHVQAVASRIRASMFYFDVTSVQQRSQRGVGIWQIDGQLRCRLKRQFSRQFLALLQGNEHGPCRFRVRRNTKSTNWNFDPADWNMAKFSHAATFLTFDRRSVMAIEMTFGTSEEWEMISGFPRVLEVSR